MKSQPQEAAAALLAKLDEQGGKNSYELAYLSLAKFLFANKYGNALEQMNYLESALSFSNEMKDVVFLPKKEAAFARRELMRLQVKNLRYREALDTYHYFESAKDSESVAMFKPIVDQLLDLEKSDSGYQVSLVLNENGHTSIKLFKQKVYALGIEGKVNEFKVRCEKKYVGFVVEAEIAYDIPKQWGICDLEIIGDPQTKLQLGQQ